jgi:sugar-specific transcriptional regulator TrmB
MTAGADPDRLLDELGLKEYERTALRELLSIGRTTAPNLAEATGIPKARIYGVLESLANAGYVKVFPGRPKEFQPKPPGEILDRATENRRQSFESFRSRIDELREEFLATFGPLYEQASEEVSPTEELFHVVDVGDPSETETRRLYRAAERELHVVTKSFEYLPRVADALADAVERGVDVRVLLLQPRHLSEANAEIQREVVAELRESSPSVAIRFSEERLPWRGTIVDPDMNYESGEAVLLVEEKEIPLHQRQAAVTENASFVAGMQRYFELVWAHESVDEYPEPDALESDA